MEDIDWWVWALIAVAVVAAIVLGTMLARRAKVKKTVARREEAAHIRDEARGVEVEARRKEADAATIRAEAEQARVEAERLDHAAKEREREASRVRGDVDERLAEADRIDPDDTPDGRTAGSHVDRAAAEGPTTTSPTQPAHAAGDEPPRDAIDPDGRR